jgi:NADPH2:quinone reductase
LHSEPSWPQRARQIADGKGVHLAVDGIGGAMLAQTLASVRPFGVTVSLGQPAGPIPPIKAEDLGFARSIGLVRPSVLAYVNEPQWYREGAGDLLRVLENGMATPVGSAYSLREAARAHTDLGAGRTTGSVILTV